MLWLLAHMAYSAYGHTPWGVDEVPYVVAHRHAAGNWAQGVLVIKKSAAAKLAKVVSHAGCPAQGPGYLGEWWGFQAFMAFTWGWNINSKLLPALVLDAMKGKGAAPVGPFHKSGDFIFIHSVLFFDAICAHLRFDGLSSVALVEELGKVCGFEKDECTLCWAGAFPSFVPSLGISPSGKGLIEKATPLASWKIIDSKTGLVKGGKYAATDLTDPAYKKPSDLPKTKLPALIEAAKTKAA